MPVADPGRLSIDVTSDGATRRLDTATGDVDEGAAAPLDGEVAGARDLDCGDGARIESGAASATVTINGQPPVDEVTGAFGETEPGASARTLQVFDAPASGGEAVVDVTVRTAEGPIDHEVSVALP